ncbi:hypothetical protein [Falsiroseomonas oryziterrae]|uniref:hypothetical protein n=1 Tax=Falsiroseomonas oryziterrae TaxID=2911368 RepID=UPI001F34669B|nr:hypothetical protein [Roseomonas sp. NPKOSM-4]
MPSLPDTSDRIRRNTAEAVNRRIAEGTAHRVAFLAQHPDFIDRRLRELDAEWDTERVLEANAATIALAGTLLGLMGDRRFLAVPVVVTGFLLQHALQGWCPPLPVIRRMGVRTAREIETERAALKAIRGDFAQLTGLRGAPIHAEGGLTTA